MQNQIELDMLKKCRILIIEDNDYVRDAFELTLHRTGLNATVLTTGEEGLEVVRNGAFDVIISDYRLPGMDGIEFFEKIQSHTSDIIKVLISSYGFENITAEARDLGVTHFFQKPFSIHKLLIELNISKSLSDIKHQN